MHTGWPVPVRRFPELTVATPRLHVRPLAGGDAKPVAEIFADPRTQRWLPFPPQVMPLDGLAWSTELAHERRAAGDGDHYGAIRREDGCLIGCLWTQRADWVSASVECRTRSIRPRAGSAWRPRPWTPWPSRCCSSTASSGWRSGSLPATWRHGGSRRRRVS